MRDQTNQAIDAVTKMAPPAAVTFYSSVLDMPLEKWVAVLTILYMGIQIYLLIRDRVIRRRRKSDLLENEE